MDLTVYQFHHSTRDFLDATNTVARFCFDDQLVQHAAICTCDFARHCEVKDLLLIDYRANDFTYGLVHVFLGTDFAVNILTHGYSIMDYCASLVENKIPTRPLIKRCCLRMGRP